MFSFLLIYLFRWVFVVACGLLVAACGIQFPDQGSNPGPLRWKHGVLATGPPGSPASVFFSFFLIYVYLLIRLCRVLVAVCELLVEACGI